MCLHTQDKSHKALKTYRQRIGWKVFVQGKGHPIFEHQGHHDKFVVPLHKWLVARPKDTISDSQGTPYRPGFHIYLERPHWFCRQTTYAVLYKVRWKGPYTSGEQRCVPIVVARKMIVDGPDNG